ncbi:MAG: glycosyltransferase family 4 protein [Candidatus Cloacimonetes bacterium]|nr:glycosyltransferase family 4 protein [Candidatus Cloacimonadota bacterium]
MKILYITQYFIPETCAPSNRAYATIKYLSDAGHQVAVLTEMPNHPKGIIYKGYKRKLFCRERIDGFDVLRTWIYTSPKKNFITRILFYSTFMIFGIITALSTWRNYDIIFISSPPLFVGGIGVVLKKLFPKIKFIFEVRDLWPDVAVEIGELSNKTFIDLSTKLAISCYTLSNKIISVTNYFRDEIIKKGIPRNKIDVIRNGTDINNWHKVDFENIFIKYNINIENKFLVIYAGNLGLAQGIDTILYAAKKLKDYSDILFLIIGDGPEKEKLYNIASEHSLKNVIFIEEKPREEISQYLSAAHCGIVPLKRSKVFYGTIPSKLFDYLACELPVLLGVDGEAREILEESKAGLFYKPEDYHDLAEKIIMLKTNSELVIMGKRGRKFVEDYYNRKKLSENIEKIIFDTLKKKYGE